MVPEGNLNVILKVTELIHIHEYIKSFLILTISLAYCVEITRGLSKESMRFPNLFVKLLRFFVVPWKRFYILKMCD